MKNKKIFSEKRLIFEDSSPEATEAAEASDEYNKTLELIDAIRDNGIDIAGSATSAAILEDNPYKSYLLEIPKDAGGNFLKFHSTEKKKGSLKLIYRPDVDEDDLLITGFEYVALFWPNIKEKLDKFFEDEYISPALMKLAAERNLKKFNKLVLEVAKRGDKVDPALVEDVLDELQELKGKVDIKGAKDMVKMRGETAREGVKRGIKRKAYKPLPVKAPLDAGHFIEQVERGEVTRSVDRLRINPVREALQINAGTWDLNALNMEELERIYQDCRDLEIPVGDEFYQTMFAVLRNAYDHNTNPYLNKEETMAYFERPANHMSQIVNLDPTEKPAGKPQFWGGEQFASAFQHLQFLQGKLLIAQDKAQIDTFAKQEDLDKDPVATKVTDFLRTNLSKFKKAIKERDYATAGMYAVGIWAIYASIKKLTEGKGDKVMKWIAYGTALYAGNVFLKNAGYDVLKMTGFRDADYEVKGTPMEVMRNILQSNPKLWEKTKDIDYGIVLKVSNVRLTTLNELFMASNAAGGVGFIHPREFPSIFTELAPLYGFKMGLGEKGPDGSAGMSNVKLSPAQREYVRVGQQLYKIAFALRESYNLTLRPDHPNYKGLTYDEALSDRTVGFAKVRHLMDAMSPYATITPSEGFFTKNKQELEDNLKEAFKERANDGVYIENEIGNGHFKGYINGFPVIFAQHRDVYRVYIVGNNTYGGKFKPGDKFIAEIPKEGGNRAAAAKRASDAVKKRVKKLLKPLDDLAGQKITDTTLEYKNGKWTCKAKLTNTGEFDLSADPVDVEITSRKDGKAVFLKTEGGVVITLDTEVGKQHSAALGVLPKLVGQKEFHALRTFAQAGLMQYRKHAGAKLGEFTLVLGKNDIEVKIKYEKGPKKFKFAPGQEKKLVGSDFFAQEYLNALEADETFEFNDTVEKLKDVVKTADEDHLAHIWKTLTGNAKSPVGGANLGALTGSVPDYFSNTVIDVTKYEAMQKLRRAILDAKSLQDVEDAKRDILYDANAGLEGVYETLSAENANMGSWDAEDYLNRIIYPIRKASKKSTAYYDARDDFEYKVYGLSGVLTSDVSEGAHQRSAALLKVFAYYTAYLDNPEYIYTDPNGVLRKKKIDLDKPGPPELLAPKLYGGKTMAKPTQDPGLRQHYILRYFEYVKREVLNRSKSKIKDGDFDNIPDGSARGFWNIDDFEDWLEKKGSYISVNKLDNLPLLKHDPKDHLGANPKHTELDRDIKKAFEDAALMLLEQYPAALSWPAIDEYLRGKKRPDFGLLTVYRNAGAADAICGIWGFSDSLAHLTKRSVQKKEIKKLVDDHLIDHIYENPGRFFKQKAKFSARLRKRFPKLAEWGL